MKIKKMPIVIALAIVAALLFGAPTLHAADAATVAVVTPPKATEAKAPEGVDSITVENFSKYNDGQFPKSWKSWPLQRDKVMQIYKVVAENGKKFLRASDDKDLSQQIMLIFEWPVKDMPYLSWRWRPRVLPTGAIESDDNKNDSACGVYVIFGRYTGVAQKYVWSTSLPVGQVVSRRDGKLRIKSLASGNGGVGSWHTVSVNVPEDYEKMFGAKMDKAPSGVAVLTDGNATHTPAECDYADFTISKKPM